MGFYDLLIKDPTRNPTQQKRKKIERKTGSKDQTTNSTGHFRHQDLGNNNTLQFKHHFPIPLKKDLTPTQHNTTQNCNFFHFQIPLKPYFIPHENPPFSLIHTFIFCGVYRLG